MALKVNIIGAGLGGLATACLLAAQGHGVTVFEKNDTPGGKINQIKSQGFRFDCGPSLLTMPSTVKKLFRRCGVSPANYLSTEPIDPICRYIFQDGTVFDCYQNIADARSEIENIAPGEHGHYQKFLDYSSRLFKRTNAAFLQNPLYDLSDFTHLNLFDALRINAFQSMARRIDNSFESPYLRLFFKRFATYNGSSPYRAPATLNVIPHVELSLGGYYLRGGMYQLIRALMMLARKLKVQFHFNTPVEAIRLQNQRASALQTADGQLFKADIIVSNSDAASTYLHLLPSRAISALKRKSIRSREPSCSGFVMLLGLNRKYEQLRHHNVIFSKNYRREFHQIFDKKIMPDDPTIYVANTSVSEPADAPPGASNLFILVNAPYLSKAWSWNKRGTSYGNLIIKRLQNQGLHGLNKAIVFRRHITPLDFKQHYNAWKGSIYGTSSNSRWAAFLRAANKSRQVHGLYLTGGSTHPGGGIPLVILSAFHTVDLIERYELNI